MKALDVDQNTVYLYLYNAGKAVAAKCLLAMAKFRRAFRLRDSSSSFTIDCNISSGMCTVIVKLLIIYQVLACAKI